MQLFRTATRTAAWLAAAFVVVTPLTSPGGPLSFAHVAMEQPVLSVSGSIDGLEVGRPASLALTVSNSSDDAVVVHQLTARVTAASAGCDLAALRIRPWRGSLLVPAHGSAAGVLPVLLTRACPSASWSLAYTAL
jgi:hypothetical protein